MKMHLVRKAITRTTIWAEAIQIAGVFVVQTPYFNSKVIRPVGNVSPRWTDAPLVWEHCLIDQHFPGRGNKFAKAALHLRGVTAWVEREGTIAVGDEVSVHVPAQPGHPEYS